MTKPTEGEIQKVLKMLKSSDPKKATRENAIQTIKGMKKLAKSVVDRVDDDLKSGKVTVSEDGKVDRKD